MPQGLQERLKFTPPNNYETSLTPEQERQFQVWKRKYAPNDSGANYDLRGAFLAGLTPDPETGHWFDTFKKPSHPTFSNESQYAKFEPTRAGSWGGSDGETFLPPHTGLQEPKRSPLREAFFSGHRGYDPRLELTPEGITSLLPLLQPVVPATEKLLSLPGLEPLSGETFPRGMPRPWEAEMERSQRVREFGRGVAQTVGDILPLTPLDIAGAGAAGLPAVARGAKAGLRLAKEGLETGAGLARGARSAYRASPWASEAGFLNVGPPGASALPRPAPRGPFYSRLAEALTEKLPAKAPAAQIEATLKNAGVSPAEIEATGLKKLFAQKGQEPISKDELAQWVEQNRVAIEEEVIGQPAPQPAVDISGWTVDPAEQVRWRHPVSVPFSQWQLPGGENYRIVAVKAPETPTPPRSYSVRPARNNDGFAVYDDADDSQISGGVLTEREAAALAKQWSTDPLNRKKGPTFTSPHSGIPDNTIVHLRMNDRTLPDGKKALFLEELQSDWMVAGRREGFADPDKKRFIVRDRTGELVGRFATKEEATAMRDRLGANAYTAHELPADSGIQTTPLLDRWAEVGMKRALYEAAANDYDSLAWTTGKQQADRYDLSKQIDKLQYRGGDDGTWIVEGLRDRERVLEKTVPDADLEATVGKDIAAKMRSALDNPSYHPKIGRVLDSVDLKIGGEWAANLYDKQLVNIVNKLVKKWGGRVASADVGIQKAQKFGDFKNELKELSSDVEMAEEVGDATMGTAYLIRRLAREGRDWPSSDIYEHLSKIENEESAAVNARYGVVASDYGKARKLLLDAGIKPKSAKETVHTVELPEAARKAIREKGFPLFEGAGAAIGGESLRQAYEEGRKREGMSPMPRVY